MGLRKTLVKSAVLHWAPRTVVAAMNPQRAVVATAATWALKRMAPSGPKRHSMLATTGLGVAAVALPLGIWLGSRYFSRDSLDPLSA